MIIWPWLLALPGHAKDFLWLSQGRDSLAKWLYDLSEQPNSYVLMGLWGPCIMPDISEKRRLVCIERNVDVVKGRSQIFPHGDEWERQRGTRFHYFIWSDDNAEFDYVPKCTPAHCGDASLLPLQNEKAVMYWQRLLEEDQPAAAAPIIHNPPRCNPSSMYSCTSSIDGKLVAFHWSARKMLAIHVDDFAPVSCMALSCLYAEIMEAGFRGYTWVYRMFQRIGNSTRFAEPRGNYVRNMHPCFPRRLPDGWGDSAVVAWLRPQLTSCASKRLGPALELQRSCKPLPICLRPPPDVNYSAFLSCLPWASKDSEDFCKAKPVGKGPQEVSEHWMKMNAGMLGHGLPDLPDETNSTSDRLCKLGRRNLDALARQFHFPRSSRAFKNILVAVKRFGEHENDCHHLCTAIIIGAGTLARSLSPISMKCRSLTWNTCHRSGPSSCRCQKQIGKRYR
ncbi:Uncharacterized protein SCF082_LOCUS22127 [Durusdinium trenchii]|uniref:Uncharacterized protein n=1 Tax=Durusdinium trenchii TaxID=1381693 RepID=A0ABP0LF68_9DINO